MENLLIVNADDFGLSKGQNYGIIEACRRGVVTSTTALVNGEAVEHAAQLSREVPELGVGMHFVLTLGMPLSPMPGLTRDGQLGKWIWERAEQGALPLEEIARELECQFNRFTINQCRSGCHNPPATGFNNAVVLTFREAKIISINDQQVFHCASS